MIDYRQRSDSFFIKTLNFDGFRGSSRELDFGHVNFINGVNASGKTQLLNLIVGLTGVDAATELLKRDTFGEVEIILGSGNTEYRYSAKDRFDIGEIAEWKKTLPTRSSMTASRRYIEPYIYDQSVDDAALVGMIKALNERSPLYLSVGDMGAAIKVGGGFRQLIRHFKVLCTDSGPALINHGDSSLDHWNCAIFYQGMLDDLKKQYIFTSYKRYNDFDNGIKNIVF